MGHGVYITLRSRTGDIGRKFGIGSRKTDSVFVFPKILEINKMDMPRNLNWRIVFIFIFGHYYVHSYTNYK